ncbi:MAG TPA: hypothetical protein VEQ10_15955, partial [Vicinamibacteria bacterium]|nr:hypothetical protein [Vicinamibacteria bacterium]
RATLAVAALAALVLVTCPLALVRVDVVHQFPIRFPALVLVPGLWCLIADALALPRAAAGLGVVALAPFLLRPISVETSRLSRLPSQWHDGTSHGIPRAWGVPLDADQAEAIRAVRTRLPAEAPLFVGNTRHDLAYINDAIFYFLAERRCVTYYHNLLPGLVTTERVQRQMGAELARAAPPLVVLRAGLESGQEPNQSRRPSGVTLLDDAIRASYHQDVVVGRYQIWTRR